MVRSRRCATHIFKLLQHYGYEVYRYDADRGGYHRTGRASREYRQFDNTLNYGGKRRFLGL
jgi:hypothetical protein